MVRTTAALKVVELYQHTTGPKHRILAPEVASRSVLMFGRGVFNHSHTVRKLEITLH